MNMKTEEDKQSSPVLDVVESPRKRMRLDNSARKSWSLMDRRTDVEVLQEMGVSLLEPDDSENIFETTNIMHKTSLKRKHDIENVNPNITVSISPSNRKCSPGPSKKSPRSCDKTKPLQPLEQTEKTYPVDEETPLAQSVSAQYKPCADPRRRSDTRDISITEEQCTLIVPTTTEDSFSLLPDEVLLGVLRWLPKRALAHCALLSKRFYRLACDETLWQRLDLGNKTLSKDALGKILDRKPVIVRLASSEIGDWNPTTPPIQSRIQYLDLSMCSISSDTLCHLLSRCSGLKKLSLESVKLCELSQNLLGKCSNLETLNLAMARGITTEGLTAILKGCTSLQSLNISWCNLSEASLQVLVTSLPTNLQRLNISGARALTDDMVATLAARCPRLLELDASDCALLAARALRPLAALRRLEHLALSRCYLLPPHALAKLSCLPALQYLEVWGTLQAPSLAALRAALPAIQLNHFMFSAIARPTVGARRTSVWGLRTRD
ncbi:unnamed protein product, partial [Brenthis ino]